MQGINFKNNIQMMKNIKRFSAITIIGLLLLVFNSCDDNSEIFTISAPTAPVLIELGFTDLELDAVNTQDNPAVTLNWNEADYGQQASVTYAIRILLAMKLLQLQLLRQLLQVKTLLLYL